MSVITLSGNLLAEWTFDIGNLKAGSTHRAQAMSFQVGGKGINVSRILNRLSVENEAFTFAEGPMADLCKRWLDQHAIAHRFFPLEEGVRPGFVIREKETFDHGESTFLGADILVPESSWEAACLTIGADKPAWVAICGSIPGWKSNWTSPIRAWIESPSPIRVCVDTYGAALTDLITLPIDVVKINRVELDKLFPHRTTQATEAVLAEARNLSPVRNWIITDGPNPVTASLENGEQYTVTPARLEEVSQTGSGDTFLAALIHKWMEAGAPEEALSFASACASANAASAGIGDFPLPVPDQYRPEIKRLRGTSP